MLTFFLSLFLLRLSFLRIKTQPSNHLVLISYADSRVDLYFRHCSHNFMRHSINNINYKINQQGNDINIK